MRKLHQIQQSTKETHTSRAILPNQVQEELEEPEYSLIYHKTNQLSKKAFQVRKIGLKMEETQQEVN